MVTITKLPIYMNDIRIKNIYRKWTLTLISNLEIFHLTQNLISESNENNLQTTDIRQTDCYRVPEEWGLTTGKGGHSTNIPALKVDNYSTC